MTLDSNRNVVPLSVVSPSDCDWGAQVTPRPKPLKGVPGVGFAELFLTAIKSVAKNLTKQSKAVHFYLLGPLAPNSAALA